MKTRNIVLIISAALLSLNCSKENTWTEPHDKVQSKFDLCAQISTTRTNIEGLATSWADGDALAIFHTESGSSVYGSNDKFTISADNLATGKFTGTLTEGLETSKAYNWYAVYPYRAVSTPASYGDGETAAFNVGRENITQTGNDSKAHLAGPYCPLAGRLSDLTGDSKPAFEMNHLSSVLAIEVTNNSGEPLTVTTIALTSDEEIVGKFHLDITGEQVIYTADATGSSKTSTLAVSGAEAIADGSKATFYIPLKPHTVEAGNEMKLSVNRYEKVSAAGKDIVFTAGTIHRISFDFDQATDYSGDYLIINSDKTHAAKALEGTNTDLKAMEIRTDSDGNVIRETGIESCKFSLTKITEGEYKGTYTLTDVNGKYIVSADVSGSNAIAGTDAPEARGYWSVTANPDGTWYISASHASNTLSKDLRFNARTVAFSCYEPGKNKNIILYPYSNLKEDLTPRIEMSENSLKVLATATSVSFGYILHNIAGLPTASVTSGDIANLTVIPGETSVTLNFDANTGNTERTSTVTLSYPGAEDVILTLTQSSADTGAPYSWILYDGVNKMAWDKPTVYENITWTPARVGSGSITLGKEANGMQFGNSNKPVSEMTFTGTGYSGGIKKIVINTSWKDAEGAKLVSVTAGGTEMASNPIALTRTATDYEFTSETALTGDIVLKWTNVGEDGTTAIASGIYVKSISIN